MNLNLVRLGCLGYFQDFLIKLLCKNIVLNFGNDDGYSFVGRNQTAENHFVFLHIFFELLEFFRCLWHSFEELFDIHPVFCAHNIVSSIK